MGSAAGVKGLCGQGKYQHCKLPINFPLSLCSIVPSDQVYPGGCIILVLR